MNLNNLKGKVEYVLKHFPETRNSDRHLTWKVWQQFHGVGSLITEIQYAAALPNPAEIQRIRAKFNSRDEYLPDDETVMMRRFSEKKWRRLLGYKEEPKPAVIPAVSMKKAPLQQELL